VLIIHFAQKITTKFLQRLTLSSGLFHLSVHRILAATDPLQRPLHACYLPVYPDILTRQRQEEFTERI
jgi:hypothetical protein